MIYILLSCFHLAELCNEFVAQTSDTDKHDDGQSRENFKQVDVATNTFTSEWRVY